MIRTFVAVVLAVAAVGGESTETARARPLVLDYAPYLGLACHATYPCARVGIAVWLPRRARSVGVLVQGRVLELHTGPGSGLYGRGLFWQGFFADRAAERIAGDLSQTLEVQTLGVFRDGDRFVTDDRSPVSSGYC